MEEILASIRRIIADDDQTKTTKPPASAAPAPPPAAVAPPKPAPPRPAAPPPAPPKVSAPLKQDAIDAVMAAPEPPKAQPKPAAPDVLELTESMTTTPPPGPAPSFRTIDGAADVIFTDRASDPHPEPPRNAVVEEARRQFTQAAGPERSLLSQSATSAVDSAFNSLAHTVLVQNARTLEDLVREMLRPMLKAWLDDNLPGMVERIVRAEIERVSRGRG